MSKILAVSVREFRNSLNKRTFLAAFAMTALMLLFAFVMTPKAYSLKSVDMGFMILMFGGIIGVSLTFDVLTKEREAGSLDLLLTHSLSKWQLVLGKFLACIFICALTGLLVTSVGVLVVYFRGKSIPSQDIVNLFSATPLFLMVYGMFGFAASAIFGSSKMALPPSIIIWLFLRPAVSFNLIDKLRQLLHWSDKTASYVLGTLPDYAYSTALARGLGSTQTPFGNISLPSWQPYLVLVAYISVLLVAAVIVFPLHEESSYQRY